MYLSQFQKEIIDKNIDKRMNGELIFLQVGGMDPGTLNIVFMGAMLAIFYFFMIRPQAKKQRLQQQFETDMGEGDKVVTSSGIIGKVSRLEKNAIVLEVGAGTKTSIRVLKSAISREMSEELNNETE